MLGDGKCAIIERGASSSSDLSFGKCAKFGSDVCVG